MRRYSARLRHLFFFASPSVGVSRKDVFDRSDRFSETKDVMRLKSYFGIWLDF
jgi:hypothetical protein